MDKWFGGKRWLNSPLDVIRDRASTARRTAGFTVTKEGKPMLKLVDLELARSFAMGEIDAEIAAGTLYISPRLSSDGARRYPTLLGRPHSTTTTTGWNRRFVVATC